MTPWPTPPAELRAAVGMLHGMRHDGSVIDEQLAIAVLLAPDRAVATLIAMRVSVHTPPTGAPVESERFQSWCEGWGDYRRAVSLLPEVASHLYAQLDDDQRARWWEQAS